MRLENIIYPGGYPWAAHKFKNQVTVEQGILYESCCSSTKRTESSHNGSSRWWTKSYILFKSEHSVENLFFACLPSFDYSQVL